MNVHFDQSFDNIPSGIRTALSRAPHNPFFNTAFLQLLERCGCVSESNGWKAHHLWIERDGVPVFFMPIYEKSHSWGEFVFDQSWAQAFERHGLPYYPKWTTAIPFTPSVGPRWWVAAGESEAELLTQAFHSIEGYLLSGAISSWHLLFSDKAPDVAAGFLARHDTQFHWRNRGYQHFNDFLDQLKSRKRKTIKKEREKIMSQNIEMVRVLGSALSLDDWQAFYQCYCNTYFQRRMTPYLTLDFFQQLGVALAHQIVMIQAHKDGRMVGAALCFFDDDTLYGRHWGANEALDCLHFEACFYQGIEFCIEKGLQRFDPGTQGEHKLLRGFEPVKTTSWHWIGHPGFKEAIAEHLQSERGESERYHDVASDYLPYKQKD